MKAGVENGLGSWRKPHAVFSALDWSGGGKRKTAGISPHSTAAIKEIGMRLRGVWSTEAHRAQQPNMKAILFKNWRNNDADLRLSFVLESDNPLHVARRESRTGPRTASHLHLSR